MHVLPSPLRDPLPADLLGHAFDTLGARPGGAGAYRMRWSDGTTTPVRPGRWLAPATPDELELLAGVAGPVLDIGCGPGRLVVALNERRIAALGIDVLPAAVRAGRRRGAAVEQRSVFDPSLRRERWATALLLDGNVGIGGDPAALLTRVSELLRPGGHALVELEPPGVGVRSQVGRLETPAGSSAVFPWGRVGADRPDDLAAGCRRELADVWQPRDRVIARLARPA